MGVISGIRRSVAEALGSCQWEVLKRNPGMEAHGIHGRHGKRRDWQNDCPSQEDEVHEFIGILIFPWNSVHSVGNHFFQG
jgi:hypothetical protein